MTNTTVLDAISDILNVLGDYVTFLFRLPIAEGVSFGALILLSLLFFVIVTNLWPRN